MNTIGRGVMLGTMVWPLVLAGCTPSGGGGTSGPLRAQVIDGPGASAGPLAVAAMAIPGNPRIVLASVWRDSNEVRLSVRQTLSPLAFTTESISGGAVQGPLALAIGDVDADGRQDIIVAQAAGNIVYLRSSNDPTRPADYQASIIAESDQTPIRSWSSVALTEIDGQGGIDIVAAANDDGRISWFRNPGNAPAGANWRRVDIATGLAKAAQCLPVDLDGDGDTDVVSVAPGAADEQVAWYQNPRTAGGIGDPFVDAWRRRPIATVPGASRVMLTDVDGDGRGDAVVASYDQNNITVVPRPADIGPDTVWTNNPVVIVQYDANHRPTDMAWQPASGEGQNNLIVATAGRGNVRYFVPPQGGPLTARWTELFIADTLPDSDVGQMLVGDVDGDQQNDIVIPVNGSEDRIVLLRSGTF